MNNEAIPQHGVSFHSLEVDAAFQHVAGSREGLTNDGAATRMDKYGPDKLSPPTKRTTLFDSWCNFTISLLRVELLFDAQKVAKNAP